MSLDTVVEEIREEAHEEATEIREAARQRADEIVAAAEKEADETVATAETEAESEVEQRRRQRVSAAKLEAKQTRLEARRAALDDVHEQVESAVADLEGERRERLTRALYEAAAEEFDGDERLRVYGREDDHDLLASIADAADHEATVAGDHDCLGGVVVEGEDSRVRVDNSFDSVLADVWEDHLREVSDRLFADVDNESDGEVGDGSESDDTDGER
ncbi:V-type ATP synthase subunit E [Halobacteriales archaeon SW_12_71_31]|nr:MAG: V-type ATP synthase subunit E [Halobacteriales archaeon SW_12_71_31]